MGQARSSGLAVRGAVLVGLLASSFVSCKQTSVGSKAQSDEPTSTGAAAVGELKVSPALQAIYDKFLAIRDKSEVEPLLAELEEKYGPAAVLDQGADGKATLKANFAASKDAVFVANQLMGLSRYRSIIYRMVPLFDKGTAAYPEQTSALHNMVLAVMQASASAISIFAPYPQWDAVYRYLTEPVRETAALQFPHADALQYHLCSGAYEIHKGSTAVIEALDFDTPILLDNRVLVNGAPIVDEADRYTVIGEPERLFGLSLAHGALHGLQFFCSYSVQNSSYALEALLQIIGMDSYFDRVEGAPLARRAFFLSGGTMQGYDASARERERATNLGGKAKDSLKLKPNGKETMAVAYRHLLRSATLAKAAWAAARARGTPNAMAPLSWDRLAPWTRQTEKAVEQIHALVSGEAKTVTSAIDPKLSVQINLPAFYQNPPADLRQLLPVAYEQNRTFTITDPNGGKHEYRNYFYGRGVRWDEGVYRTYLPGLTTGQDVAVAARVLGEAWGGWIVQLPILGALL